MAGKPTTEAADKGTQTMDSELQEAIEDRPVIEIEAGPTANPAIAEILESSEKQAHPGEMAPGARDSRGSGGSKSPVSFAGKLGSVISIEESARSSEKARKFLHDPETGKVVPAEPG